MIFDGMMEAMPLLKRLERRADMEMGEIAQRAKEIVAEVRQKGDEALFAYAKELDGTDYEKYPLELDEGEKKAAYHDVTEAQLSAIKTAIQNLKAYHEHQKEEGYSHFGAGTRMFQRVLPIARVGIYVPGGTASYPSSVLMNAVPAKIAGVEEIIMATPAKDGTINPLTIVAAVEAGVDRIFRMGGAHAIAALAYGTASVPKVDKITGPGNAYVAAAKREVFGQVGIDSIAGPSEIVIVADDSANPAYVAADLLSQAEHDVLSAAILLTNQRSVAAYVQVELEKQLSRLMRSSIARQSMESYGGIIVLEDVDACIRMANRIAPEHLELCIKDPYHFLDGVENAGGIFIGNNTPEPLGDYLAGTNHVLPTGGTSRFSSPLGVYDFYKRQSVLEYSQDALRGVGNKVITLAQAEGLTAHGEAIRIRMEEEGI
ncbi:histidinol dehydrogenase [Eubacteriales bacterium OttesenSCG-928-M02]|nr:histidinol dehydrogenase [Eubacteriales bacterium OttesenSCG-928-M02]